MSKTLALAVTTAIAISFSSTMLEADVRAAEVKVLSAAVLKPALTELAGEFERTTGHKLTIAFESAGVVRNRIQAGEIADVAIIQKPSVEALLQQGKIRPGSMVTLARSGVGVAVPKGAAKPDISSVELQAVTARRQVDFLSRSGRGARERHPFPRRDRAAGHCERGQCEGETSETHVRRISA